MSLFDPNQHQALCEAYLSRHLGGRVTLLQASQLMASTRDAPWRLDVELDGAPRSYVLRLESRGIEHEYHVLRAMAVIPIPTPRAYGWDPTGEALGRPAFFYEFVQGEPLLAPLLAGESWAEELYIETVCALQSVTREQLAGVAHRFGEGETAVDVLETAYEYLASQRLPLADAAYARLKETMPSLPELRFSNGDLWPDNLLVRDRQLAGIIDFANAGFSDPLFEFLLLFFLRPELLGRGIVRRYCQRLGFDPGVLPWYHGLEYFDTWHWVLKLGEPFEQHTAGSLEADLRRWLENA